MLAARSVSVLDVQRLAGKLQFLCRVVPPGRAFIRGLYGLLAGHGTRSSPITVDTVTRADLQWWRSFLPAWSGSCGFPAYDAPHSPLDIVVETDACLTGWGIIHRGSWAAGQWSTREREASFRTSRVSVPFLELLAIVKAALLWGREWAGRRVLFWGDCLPMVQALRKPDSSSPKIARLLRVLADQAVACRFEFTARWWSSKDNRRADLLSRGDVQVFLDENPEADRSPQRCEVDPLTSPLFSAQ